MPVMRLRVTTATVFCATGTRRSTRIKTLHPIDGPGQGDVFDAADLDATHCDFTAQLQGQSSDWRSKKML